jgi:methionyl-tRNA formyltransferase
MTKNKIYKTIFMGTPDFALPGLKELINSPDFSVIAIFTQPDKARGRKKEPSPSPVKLLAQKHNIKIYQPKKIKEEIETIQKLQADFIIVIAYGQILPIEILDSAKIACINVHASLLPKYRGASCLSAPILNGDKSTGLTIMKMDPGMDTGNILRQEKIELKGEETSQDLHDKLANLGAQILTKTLKDYARGKIQEKKQNEDQATYVKLTKKEDGKIDWTEKNTTIERKIRAYHPWPGTYCQLPNENNLKIIEAKIATEKIELKPGEVKIIGKKIIIGTGQGNIDVLKLQTSGQKIMTAESFICGHKIDGHILK